MLHYVNHVATNFVCFSFVAGQLVYIGVYLSWKLLPGLVGNSRDENDKVAGCETK